MRSGTRIALVTCIALLALALSSAGALVAQAGAPTGVFTAGYNTLRDNWDPEEPELSPSAVQSAGFGKLFSTRLSGAIYSPAARVRRHRRRDHREGERLRHQRDDGGDRVEPLIRQGLQGQDDRMLGSHAVHRLDLDTVVEPSTGTVYMTTRLQVGNGLQNAHWYLQALSAATGQELPGYPVPITGTPVNTPGVPFNESYEMQRPALLLLNGVVYMGFASDCDITPYRGIVAAVNTSTRALTMWSDESGPGTDENSQAGIWQSGEGWYPTYRAGSSSPPATGYRRHRRRPTNPRRRSQSPLWA